MLGQVLNQQPGEPFRFDLQRKVARVLKNLKPLLTGDVACVGFSSFPRYISGPGGHRNSVGMVTEGTLAPDRSVRLHAKQLKSMIAIFE